MDSSIVNTIRRTINKARVALANFYWYLRRDKTKAKANGKLSANGRLQLNLDKKLVYSLSRTRWPSLKQVKYVKRYLSSGELWVIRSCFLAILLSLIFLGGRFYVNHLQNVPVNGGEYIEGVVGAPKHINPLYASVSDVDSDITSLIYSSLFKRDGEGKLANDLVESYETGADGKSYTVKIKSGVKWHNGSVLAVDDIVFTFNAIKDSQYKSPLRASFSGVELEAVDDTTIKFTLSEPYAAFLDLLTFGILPQELWQQINPEAANLAELNLKPVGSGLYQFKSLVKDKSGNIKSYTLARNDDYYGQSPYLDKITFKFFGSFQESIAALNNNLVNGINYLPEQYKGDVVAKDSLNFYQFNFPQLVTIFFNPKVNAALSDKKVRQALAYALDKNDIISQAVGGSARLIDGPIVPDSFAYNANIKKYNYDVASAGKLLDEAGWKITAIKESDIKQAQADANSSDEAIKKKAELMLSLGIGDWRTKNNNYLTIDLITVDLPEYTKAAEEISKFWQAVNVKTTVNLVPDNKVQSEVIRQRNFAALLYSELAGADPDPYAFWHSSQTGQAGLNIADYANKEVDKLLEDARLTNDTKIRQEKYNQFQTIIAEESPAIFLYSPYYTYVQTKKIKGLAVKSVVLPYNRFADINYWYTKIGKKLVW